MRFLISLRRQQGIPQIRRGIQPLLAWLSVIPFPITRATKTKNQVCAGLLMDTLKLILNIDCTEVWDATNMRKLGGCIVSLISQSHRVLVVHGNQAPASHDLKSVEGAQADVPESLAGSGMSEVLPVVHANKCLASLLNILGVPAFGFCGLDGNIVHLRLNSRTNAHEAEVASISPFWLNVVTENGGVPVLGNIGVAPDRSWKTLSSDQLATKCAVAWNADSLIFVIADKGVRSDQGDVMRWLNVADIPRVEVANKGNIGAKLQGCIEALETGVYRTRLFPVSHIEHLSEFYSAAIEYGTEVVNADRKISLAMANGGSHNRPASKK
jgi:acetylglutamate kinase